MRALPVALAVVALAAATGCGLGPGSTPSGVRLTVTQDFGTRVLHRLDAPRVLGQETVMRLLEANARVSTRYGGGFVQSIDGQAGGREGARPIDWFYYVNGSEAAVGATDRRVAPGDRVWWDRHDWGAAMATPAVVGSFPEPFLHGSDGKRLPVRVECAPAESDACTTVTERLGSLGVPAARGTLDVSAGANTLRVLVGPWSMLRGDTTAARLEQGPAASGVYAKPSSTGAAIALLNPTGATTTTLGAGAGLVAAIREGDHQPIWLVTGTDAGGVSRAADALDEQTLRDRFAVALAATGPLSVPEVAR